MNQGERLQKVIARSGLVSRRGAERLIAAGRVRVNGRIAPPGRLVDPERAEVLVDGVPLPVAPERVRYLLHKPEGVVTTTDDPHGRRTVVEMVPPRPLVFPAGRLDADTTGLLILTNDGALANLVAHPSRGMTKTYIALVGGRPRPWDVERLEKGMELEDGPARALSARILGQGGASSHLELVMGEGRNREVRRLCAAAGFPVLQLHRVAIGPLRDRSLPAGEWRHMSAEEVRNLYRAARAPRDPRADAPASGAGGVRGKARK